MFLEWKLLSRYKEQSSIPVGHIHERVLSKGDCVKSWYSDSPLRRCSYWVSNTIQYNILYLTKVT